MIKYELNNTDKKKACVILLNILGTNIENKTIHILETTKII